jgi:hypothetical protein
MDTGSPTLHKRLPSLRIQARSLGYSAVLANRAGSQSSHKLRPRSVFRAVRLPSEPTILLIPSTKISTISIIQGRSSAFRRKVRPRSGMPRRHETRSGHPLRCPIPAARGPSCDAPRRPIPRSCNAAMRHKNYTICPVAGSPGR